MHSLFQLVQRCATRINEVVQVSEKIPSILKNRTCGGFLQVV